MGFKGIVSSLKFMQTNFYFSGTVQRLRMAAVSSKFPEGRTTSFPLAFPEPSTTLAKTRLCLNPGVLRGVPKPILLNPPAALHALSGLGDPLHSPLFLLAAVLGCYALTVCTPSLLSPCIRVTTSTV